MKPLKIAGVILALIVAVAGIGIIVIASRFDAPRIKAELTRVVQEKQQRTLKIDGDLELGFWPDIGVKIGKLSLSERRAEQIFASADSARVSVALLPLLSKRIVVSSVALNDARVALIRHKDGTLNIDDLFSQDKTQRQPLRLDIAAIKVANAQVNWIDEKSGSTTTVSGLDIATGVVSVDSGRKTYSIADLTLAARGKTGADSFELSLKAPRLELSPQKSGGDTATLVASLSGAAHQLNVKLALSGVEGTGQAFKVAKIALDLDGRAGEITFKGKMDSALTADLERMSATLEGLSGELTLTDPKLPMKQIAVPFSGGLKLDLSARSAEGNLAARLDESKIALKINNAGLSPPSLGFDLDIDRINVDKYLPPQQADGGKLDFSALKNLKLDGTVHIGSLQAAKLKVRDLKLRIKTTDGRLDVSPHSARLYGGTLALDARGNAGAAKEVLSGIRVGRLLAKSCNAAQASKQDDHHVAMPWTQVPAFIVALRKLDGEGAARDKGVIDVDARGVTRYNKP